MDMKLQKEKILEDNQLPTPSRFSSMGDPTSSTSSSTGDPRPSSPSHTIRSNDIYVYGIGMLDVVAMDVSVFFAYNTFQPKNKKLVNEKQDQPPKRRQML